MTGKAVISLTTGLEDPEKVTVAFLVAVGAAESGRPTLMFQAKEAARLALEDVATGVACDGCPPLRDLLVRYRQAGGRYMVCPVCFNAKQLDKGSLLPNAELAGTVQLWEWRAAKVAGEGAGGMREAGRRVTRSGARQPPAIVTPYPARRRPTVTARTRSDDALDSASSPKSQASPAHALSLGVSGSIAVVVSSSRKPPDWCCHSLA